MYGKSKLQIANSRWQSVKQRGFTLIELLVVISIVGILTSILTVNLMNVRMRGRDTQRKSDLARIQSALERYYADAGTYPVFGDIETAWGCDKLPGWNYPSDIKCSLENPQDSYRDNNNQSKIKYIDKIPDDPSWKAGSCTNTNANYLLMSNGKQYTLFAKLENTNDADAQRAKAAPFDSSAGGSTDGNKTYKIGSGTCANAVYNYWVNSPK